MISTDIYSVTDLRVKGKAIIDGVQKRPQFIFKNNRLVGVVISPKVYDRMLHDEYFTKEDEASYQQFKKEHKNGETYTLDEVKKMFNV